MPTDETNQIEVDPSRVYFITGRSLQKLLATLKANKPLAGNNITLTESDTGITVDAECTFIT